MSVSIALCTYNGEKYLGRQLDSIAGQTLLPGELVACDDCSSDGTVKILHEFARKVPFPVRIHQNERNLGSTRNFEQGIGLCSGEIIALCDQDDVWKPRKLERLLGALRENPQAGYVFSDAEVVDENLKPLDHSLWESIGFRGEIKARFTKGEQFRFLIGTHIVTGSTMAFRARAGKLAIPFPEKGSWIHDAWIALVSSAAGFPGVALEEALILYRQHSSQQLGAPEPRKRPSLPDRYRELKASQKSLFAAWETRCLQVLTLKGRLRQLWERHDSPALEKNLRFLREFETHFQARRKILTSRGPGRYGLILREAFSGRYAEFSDSWRSVFRDLFL